MMFSLQKLKNYLETAKNYKFKTFQKLSKEASNQKSSESKVQSELKMIQNGIFKNVKTQRLPQKDPKTKNSKISKSHVRRPQVKFFENVIQLTFQSINNGISKMSKVKKKPQNLNYKRYTHCFRKSQIMNI